MSDSDVGDLICLVTRLEGHLHARQQHPDFEYACAVIGRKSAENPLDKLDGDDWQPNPWVDSRYLELADKLSRGERLPEPTVGAGCNWFRHDYTEDHYYYRHKDPMSRPAPPKGATSC